MTTLKPLKSNIIFTFVDETVGSKGKFTERQVGSIYIPVLDSAQKLPRWGHVVAVGPDSGVKVGEYILINALMWSFGTQEIDGQKYWKTDDEQVIMATDDYESTLGVSF